MGLHVQVYSAADNVCMCDVALPSRINQAVFTTVSGGEGGASDVRIATVCENMTLYLHSLSGAEVHALITIVLWMRYIEFVFMFMLFLFIIDCSVELERFGWAPSRFEYLHCIRASYTINQERGHASNRWCCWELFGGGLVHGCGDCAQLQRCGGREQARRCAASYYQD